MKERRRLRAKVTTGVMVDERGRVSNEMNENVCVSRIKLLMNQLIDDDLCRGIVELVYRMYASIP